MQILEASKESWMKEMKAHAFVTSTGTGSVDYTATSGLSDVKHTCICL